MGDLGRTWWLWGVLLGLGSPDAHAVTYTLHRSSILTSRASFEMRYRVALDPVIGHREGTGAGTKWPVLSLHVDESTTAADLTQAGVDTLLQHR